MDIEKVSDTSNYIIDRGIYELNLSDEEKQQLEDFLRRENVAFDDGVERSFFLCKTSEKFSIGYRHKYKDSTMHSFLTEVAFGDLLDIFPDHQKKLIILLF